MDLTVIPTGCYCYSHVNGKQVNCPYWSMRPDKPVQDNGYCAFLGRGDWESEHISLLWDQVKECGINKPSDYGVKNGKSLCPEV